MRLPHLHCQILLDQSVRQFYELYLGLGRVVNNAPEGYGWG